MRRGVRRENAGSPYHPSETPQETAIILLDLLNLHFIVVLELEHSRPDPTATEVNGSDYYSSYCLSISVAKVLFHLAITYCNFQHSYIKMSISLCPKANCFGKGKVSLRSALKVWTKLNYMNNIKYLSQTYHSYS